MKVRSDLCPKACAFFNHDCTFTRKLTPNQFRNIYLNKQWAVASNLKAYILSEKRKK